MIFQDVMDIVSDGELSQLSVNQDAVVRALNMGLVQLYSRFPLKSKQLTLVMTGWINEYWLNSVHAVSNTSSSMVKYIDDGLEPFKDDLIKVVGVSDEGGCVIPINDYGDCGGVFMTGVDRVFVSCPVDGDALFLNYLAKPEKLVNVTGDTYIDLPDSYLDVLGAWIGYRLYVGSTDEQKGAKANSYLNLYESLCLQKEQLGLVNKDSSTTGIVFCNGGWV